MCPDSIGRRLRCTRCGNKEVRECADVLVGEFVETTPEGGHHGIRQLGGNTPFDRRCNLVGGREAGGLQRQPFGGGSDIDGSDKLTRFVCSWGVVGNGRGNHRGYTRLRKGNRWPVAPTCNSVAEVGIFRIVTVSVTPFPYFSRVGTVCSTIPTYKTEFLFVPDNSHVRTKDIPENMGEPKDP